MNKIWSVVCFVCILSLTFINPTSILPSILNATNKAIKLCFSLCASYAFWLGFFNILNQTRFPKLLSKFLSPIIDLIYGKETLTKETKNFLSLNMASNIIGIGGASTSLGIKTIESINTGQEKASFAMSMFVVINATGLQVIPTTILSMLASFGDLTASRIILPSIIASLVSTITGIVLVKIFVKKENL